MTHNTFNEDDEVFMRRALELAGQASQNSEVPVGAVCVLGSEIIGEGWNQPISTCDPSAHAEIQALRAAALHTQNYRLPETTLYVTIEPCCMCLGALVHARVKRVVFGAKEPKAGVAVSNLGLLDDAIFNHELEIEGGLLEEECASLISKFFAERRKFKAQLKAQK